MTFLTIDCVTEMIFFIMGNNILLIFLWHMSLNWVLLLFKKLICLFIFIVWS